MAEAASGGVSFIAAYLGLVKVAGVNATDSVVVIGAGGSVGSAVVQIAKWRGARVIAIERHLLANDSPTGMLSDLILNPETDDLVQRVMTFTKGAGPVWSMTASAARCLNRGWPCSVSWGVKSASRLRACAAFLSIYWISTIED
jgi:NADPH:quinone reductase-like Zn-dependent oxidoreductase